MAACSVYGHFSSLLIGDKSRRWCQRRSNLLSTSTRAGSWDYGFTGRSRRYWWSHVHHPRRLSPRWWCL